MKLAAFALLLTTLTACASPQTPLTGGFATARTGEVTTTATATATTQSTIVTIK